MARRHQGGTDGRLAGTVASPGMAAGAVAHLRTLDGMSRIAATTPAKERRRLKRAMETARREIATLIDAEAKPEAAHVLGIQIDTLADPKLIEPSLAAIDEGASALAAWQQTVAVEGAAADPADPYRAARDSDTRDLRDRVARLLTGSGPAPLPLGAIVVAGELSPSRFLEIDWSHGGGVALTGGGVNSHVAALARAKGVPMIVGLKGGEPADGTPALLDAETGTLILDPAPEERLAFNRRAVALSERTGQDARFLPEPAVTRDGERVCVAINIADPAELVAIDPDHCDGIGLVRTEFLFQGAGRLPNEKRQFAAYERIVRWAGGKPVTFRVLDAGGDKPIAGLTPEGEANPFLGLRGLRLLLRRPDVFKTQLRALLRAAALGPVRIMLPMVTLPEELAVARAIVDKVRRDLRAYKVGFGNAPLGMMVEVPAAAIAIDTFEADFYSIGSNDLVHYAAAVSRGDHDLAALARPDGVAALRLIEAVIRHGERTGCDVSLCGDMAGDPRYIDPLLERGLASLSVAPVALARTKAAVARFARPETD